MVAFLVAVLAVSAAPADAPSADQEFLESHNVHADAGGLLGYLRSFDDRRKEAVGLIPKLGSDDFDEREEATKRLKAIGLAALPELAKAAEDPDPEIRRRGEVVLASLDSEARPVLLAVLRVVRRQRTPGAAPALLKLLPRLPDEYLQSEVRDAAAASANPDDAKELRAALADGPAEVRAAALLALEKAVGDAAVEEARKRLDDPEEEVRLAALRALTPHAPRDCLDGYVALLESKNPHIRGRSTWILVRLTGQRLETVAEWKAWVRDNGKTAEMHLPLTEKAPGRGRILLCILRPSSVKELDLAGKEVFTSGDLGACCGCQGLEDGRRVFADWDNRRVVELDAKGKVAWKRDLPDTPNCLQRLDDGRTLVGLFTMRELCELKPDGGTAWNVAVDGQPTDCRRLDNGRTLVALFDVNRVEEIDRDGKVVWKIENVPAPESARRLDNGDTLVASSQTGQVLRYSPAGKVVWSAKDLPTAYDAVELESGNILIGYGGGLREVRPDGKLVREIAVGTVRRISVD